MSASQPALAIRFAQAGERQYLEDLQRRASLENEADRPFLIAHPDAIALPADHIASQSTLVVESKGAVAGFAVVLQREDGDAELDGLFVEPGHWRNGFGRRLVAASADLARQRGARFLYVTGNPEALDFYGRCGFILIGLTETRFAPAPVLRLVLTGDASGQRG